MYDFSKIKNETEKIKNHFKNEIASLRTGRATPALVENIFIDSYGTRTALKHLASISVEDAKTLRITPWDFSILKNIESALGGSNLGIQPIVDKQSIRLILPELSEERRNSLLKLLSGKFQEVKISLRIERDEVWKDIQEKERKGEISEDDKFRFKDELQKIIDKATEELGDIVKRKELEISH